MTDTTIVNWRISDPSDPNPDSYLATYTTEARAREAHATYWIRKYPERVFALTRKIVIVTYESEIL